MQECIRAQEGRVWSANAINTKTDAGQAPKSRNKAQAGRQQGPQEEGCVPCNTSMGVLGGWAFCVALASASLHGLGTCGAAHCNGAPRVHSSHRKSVLIGTGISLFLSGCKASLESWLRGCARTTRQAVKGKTPPGLQ